MESQIGRKFAIDHYYYKWNSPFPTPAQTGPSARVGSRSSTGRRGTGSWSAIANGCQDATIIAHADAFKAFGSPMYLSFHHEPENDLGTYGTPADFAAAFRHIVTVFRSRGVTNVAFVWTMMALDVRPPLGTRR